MVDLVRWIGWWAYLSIVELVDWTVDCVIYCCTVFLFGGPVDFMVDWMSEW